MGMFCKVLVIARMFYNTPNFISKNEKCVLDSSKMFAFFYNIPKIFVE